MGVRRPARGGVVVALALVVTAVCGKPAGACSYAPTLSIAQVADAGPGGTVPFFGRPVPVVGVIEYQVVSRSPALIPVSSSRAGAVKVRSWGQNASDGSDPVTQAGRSPYLGGMGDSCGPVRVPPKNAAVLKALVEDGDEIDTKTIGPEAFAYHFPAGLSADQRTRLDAAFGPSTIHETSALTRARIVAMTWAPHLFTITVAVALVIVLVRRRISMDTSGEAQAGTDRGRKQGS